MKRQQTLVEEDIELQSLYSGTKGCLHGEEQSKQVDLSSMGEALEWSPKRTPKKQKKKGFVRLSSYENQCFSSLAGGVSDNSSVNNNFSNSRSTRNLMFNSASKG